MQTGNILILQIAQGKLIILISCEKVKPVVPNSTWFAFAVKIFNKENFLLLFWGISFRAACIEDFLRPLTSSKVCAIISMNKTIDVQTRFVQENIAFHYSQTKQIKENNLQ